MRQIATTKTLYRVRDFLSWQRAGSLVLSPNFQRRPVWEKPQKSFLIDSIVRGLPIPIIFIREKSSVTDLEPQREVVDGQQRLRTLFSYIDPMCLRDYRESRDQFRVLPAQNKEIGSKSFKELDDVYKKRILDYEFSTHVLPADTDDSEVLEIFARMNATGTRLTPQELRNAKFFGDFKRTMYHLAYEQLERWRGWRIFTERRIARMQEVEMVSEAVMLILHGIQGKRQNAIDAIYAAKNDKFPGKREVTKRFRKTMDSIDEAVGKGMAKLEWHRPAMFLSLFTYAYDCIYGLKSSISPTSPKPLPRFFASRAHKTSELIKTGNLEPEVADAMRRATADLARREKRLAFLKGP